MVTIAQWVKEELGRDTWILGVSAGGPVGAGAVGALKSIRGYTSVAYTLGLVTTLLFLPQTLRILLSPKPKLFILGNHDIFTSTAMYKLMMWLCRKPRTAVLVPNAGHFDLEYSPYSKLDAQLVASFVGAGGTLPARLEGGAIHLGNASCSRWFWPSICNGGPLCIILVLLVIFLIVRSLA